MLAQHEGQIAALMMTNPNTLGLFDENIVEIARRVHDAGGQLYYDGANANAIMGITRPGDMGFDVVHFNLHKTCSTPHGGGGPGAGPIGVARASGAVPARTAAREGRAQGYFWEDAGPLSIGRVRANCGNFLVLVRAYTYIRSNGPDGLRHVSESAVLNANYVMRALQDVLRPALRPRLHARVRLLGRSAEEAGRARRSTSPSACSTSASTRRRSTSR